MKLCLDSLQLTLVDTFELLCQGFLAQPWLLRILSLPCLCSNPVCPLKCWHSRIIHEHLILLEGKGKGFTQKQMHLFFWCVLRRHWRSCPSSFHLCLSLQPFSSPSSSSEGLPSETSPQHSVTLVHVSHTFSGNSHYFFCTCKHTMCLLPYWKKMKTKNPQNPNPQSPLLPGFPLNTCLYLPFRTTVNVSSSLILIHQPDFHPHWSACGQGQERLPCCWIQQPLSQFLTLLEFCAPSDTGRGLLNSVPSQFLWSLHPGPSSLLLLFCLLPRLLFCPSAVPGPPRTMLLTTPHHASYLPFTPLDEPVSEHTGIHSDLLEWKRNWLQGGQLTQQKKMLNRPDIIGLGTEPFPGARNLQAASLGHGHQMPRICDTLPPCPSAQDSGSEERSPGRLCGRQQTFSPSAGTRGWTPSAFCRSVVMCLRARLALLEVWLHHIYPSVWPWHAAQAWYLHLLLWKMGLMIAAPPQRAWRELSEWWNRTLPGSWCVSNKCQLLLL